MTDDFPDVMTMGQLAAYLQLPKSSLYRQAQRGTLPGRKVGRQWRFHKDTVDKWLACGNQGSTPNRPPCRQMEEGIE